MRRRCQVVFFFFKQKPAYEVLSGLVGSEMSIRDRLKGVPPAAGLNTNTRAHDSKSAKNNAKSTTHIIATDAKSTCLLYTADAAEENHCVEIGSRRSIKKKLFLLFYYHI